jgi:O-antigen/teichoic acid export membrane protein
MQIGRKDVAWNFAATSLRIASGIIVMPLSLRLLSNQDIGLWGIFLTIGTLTGLLDFGFSNSFSRNITYIFSGAKELKAEGFAAVNHEDKTIDYGLLKSVIAAMRRYYGILALIFVIVFAVAGTEYMLSVLQKYNGNRTHVFIAWILYGILAAYQLYTYYYDSLLQGRGYMKRSKQIVVISQCTQIVVIVSCLLMGMGLVSMVTGLLANVIVGRILAYLSFYDKEIKKSLRQAEALPVQEIMKIMTPNALKIGLTTLGSFLITKIAMLIAPLYLPLSDIGSYGITKQMIDLIGAIGGLWFATYYPQITQYRVKDNIEGVKRLYLKSKIWLVLIFVCGGLGLIFLGEPILMLIRSKTHLLPQGAIALFVFFTLLDVNNSFSMASLLTKNEVPFVKSFLIAGIFTLSLLLLFFKFTTLGIWGMILGPAIAQCAYQNWKWPLYMAKELKISTDDYWHVIRTIRRDITK